MLVGLTEITDWPPQPVTGMVTRAPEALETVKVPFAGCAARGVNLMPNEVLLPGARTKGKEGVLRKKEEDPVRAA
jgi:hypothetical protein